MKRSSAAALVLLLAFSTGIPTAAAAHRVEEQSGKFPDAEFERIMREAEAQMQRGMAEIEHALNHAGQHVVIERHTITRHYRQVDPPAEEDLDQDDEPTVYRHPPTAQKSPPVEIERAAPLSAASSVDVNFGGWIIGLAVLAMMVASAVWCIKLARDFLVRPKAPIFSPAPYHPASPYQPAAWPPVQPTRPTHPVWSPRPGGPLTYDVPD